MQSPFEGSQCQDCRENEDQKHFLFKPNRRLHSRYHPDHADIVSSNVASCQLCQLMMGCANTVHDGDFKIKVSSKLSRAPREPYFLLYSKSHDPGRFEAWDCYSVEKTPWPEIRQLSHMPQNPFGESCLGTLRSWLQDCNEHHDDCKPAFMGHLPTRVIDVGSADGQEPHLHASQGENAPYVTLSYRWGGSLEHRTVQANLQQRFHELPLASLPALYRDAISVTRSLGVQYLWIDAVCIIQDDPTDWEREAGTMAAVYGGSYLCISASTSPSPDAGLAPSRFVPLSYTGVDYRGRSHTVYMRPSISHEFVDLDPEKLASLSDAYPTISRGWCFQERYLSPRIVHYDQGEMVWECRSTFQCECTDISGLGYLRGRDEYNTFLQKALNPSPPPDFDFVYDWAMMLEQYSATNLTFDSDILPALSGIASQIMGAGRGPYLAGLWRHELERQMTWRRSQARTPTTPTAPSFSPFSRIGPIEWFGLAGTPGSITVLDASCEPAGTDKTGAVAGGFMVVRGPLLMATVQNSTVWYDSRQWCKLECQPEKGADSAELEWDPDAEEELQQMTPGKAIAFLRLCEIVTLVLVPHNAEEDTFSRVGISNDQSVWLNEAVVKVITIK